MDDIHKKVLRTKLTFLWENLITTKVVKNLYAKEILDVDDVQRLEAEVVDSSRVKELIFMLAKRGPKAYQAFVDSVTETNQQHIKTTLEEEEKLLRQIKVENG